MPFSSRRSFPLLSLAVLLGVACSSGNNTTGSGGSTTGTGGTSSTSTNPTTTSSTGTGPDCPPGQGYMGSNLMLTGLSASATIVDLNAMPVANLVTFLCGTDICSNPATTNAQGTVSLSWNMKMVQPVFKFGDALTFPEIGIPVTTATTTFPTLTTAPLPAAGAAFTPGGDAVSGGVTISLPANGVATVDPLIYDTPDKQKFRAVEIPADKGKPVIDASGLGFEMLIGVSPANTTFCPVANLTLPNTPSWPAGTAVEIYGQSLDVGQEWAPYGGWAKIADGAVSADGKSVTSTGGIPVLLTLGVRKKM